MGLSKIQNIKSQIQAFIFIRKKSKCASLFTAQFLICLGDSICLTACFIPSFPKVAFGKKTTLICFQKSVTRYLWKFILDTLFYSHSIFVYSSWQLQLYARALIHTWHMHNHAHLLQDKVLGSHSHLQYRK